jgi:protein-tyrosine phosphatase
VTSTGPRTLWADDVPGVVTLPNGLRVRGRGLRDGPPAVGELPDFGVYLTGKPHTEPGWESRWVSWPDFRLPRSTPEAIAALAEAYDRGRTERVEIACDGGTGRTGTALAILARMSGVPAEDAVDWVRENYRARAVETPWQRRWVLRTDIHHTPRGE